MLNAVAALHSEGHCLQRPVTVGKVLEMRKLRPDMGTFWVPLTDDATREGQRADLLALRGCLRFGEKTLDAHLQSASTVADLPMLLHKMIPDWLFPSDIPRAKIEALLEGSKVALFFFKYLRFFACADVACSH